MRPSHKTMPEWQDICQKHLFSDEALSTAEGPSIKGRKTNEKVRRKPVGHELVKPGLVCQ